MRPDIGKTRAYSADESHLLRMSVGVITCLNTGRQGPYRIESELGAAEMAMVGLAGGPKPGRKVALPAEPRLNSRRRRALAGNTN